MAAGWTLLVLLALLPPGGDDPLPFPHADKVVHAVLFGGLGLLWTGVLGRARLVLGLGLAFGVATEVAQALLPFGRRGDLVDLAADAAGLALGILTARVWLEALKKRSAARLEVGGASAGPDGRRSERDSNPR